MASSVTLTMKRIGPSFNAVMAWCFGLRYCNGNCPYQPIPGAGSPLGGQVCRFESGSQLKLFRHVDVHLPTGLKAAPAALLILLLVAGCGQRALPVYAAVDSLEFADARLAACVHATAKRHGWASAGQVDTLHCSYAGAPHIESLDGIESLVNLEDLNLAHNGISDVTPLVGLKKLARLDLGFNEIEVVQSLPRALHIDLNHNRVSTLAWVNSTPTVRTLLVEYNNIADLAPLAALDGLAELRVSGNHLSSLDGLEGASQLKYLDASSNEIGRIDAIASLKLMTLLQLSGNQISDLRPLAGLTELRQLDLSANQVSDVGPLTSLYNLKVINLSNNPLRSIEPLLGLGELHELGVRGTPDLDCTQVREAIEAFGDRVVDADARCLREEVRDSDGSM